MIDEYGHAYGNNKNDGRDRNCRVIAAFQFSRCIPGTGPAFCEATQIHGVADELNTVKRGKDQRDDDKQRVLESIGKFRLAR